MSVKLPESMGQTDLAAAVLVNAVCGGDEVRLTCHACVLPDCLPSSPTLLDTIR
jgi:hypothetical protein